MEEKKKYRFADEKEQLKRVNSFCNFKCELGIVFQRRTDTWLYRAAQRSDTDSDGD